ncbi:VOC family protein [Bacteroides sp. GD17]|jgi:methylmalonyl-CoA/ethylmalonyl-CoA epimerase|uniref:VOC family protein n=1 Tax=Bacteroides sp. GD17 TaxID=3139826 RepID=UPI0026006116|nr:VOC family protein [uncultured Bacteroides sp.]
MIDNLKFHHIGYVTDSIADTSVLYLQAGYQVSPIIEDDIQRVKICFLTKQDFPKIELVEPVDERSSVNKILKKNGVSPYHVCYEVDDIKNVFNELTENQGYIPLFRPVEAVAMENKLICYLYKKETGFIELVNKF